MSKNLAQVFSANPVTTIGATDLMYVVTTGTTDAAINGTSLFSLFALKDANGNVTGNSFLSGYATTATAAATTTLTVASKYQQYFTGVTTQTVLLPVTSTLVLGQSFYIVNNSSGVVTVQSSGSNTIQAMAANTTLLVTCILTSGTTAASWNAVYNIESALTLPLSIANGGTGVSSVTTSPTASAWSGWDANSNALANNFISSYDTTATAAATTTLLVGSKYQQYFTGSTTQTVLLPVTSTLALGQSYYIVNSSSGVVTVQSSGANTIQAMAANTILLVTCISTSGTTAASWNAAYSTSASGANFPVNTNISSMTGLTGVLQAPTAITSSASLNVLSFTYTGSSTDYLNVANGTANNAALSLISSNSNGSFAILAKGTGGVVIGSVGSTTVPLSLNVGANNFSFSVPTLTTTRTLTFPDANVTLPANPIITEVISQVFTGNGTYTPTTGMKYCIVEAVGGGGAGGGTASAVGGTLSVGGGGGGGGYARSVITAATIGASQTVTIGAAGAAATAGNNAGGNGGQTSLGALVICPGGTGGGAGNVTTATTGFSGVGGAGGIPTAGDFQSTGQSGAIGFVANGAGGLGMPGAGGSSILGIGGQWTGSSLNGQSGTGYGSGSSGAYSSNSGDKASLIAQPGYIRVTEFVSV